MIFFPTRIDQYKQPGLQVTAFTKINVVLFCFLFQESTKLSYVAAMFMAILMNWGGGLTEPVSDYWDPVT